MIKIRKDFQIDTTALKQHLDAYSKLLGLTLAETIKKQAGLFCVDVMKFTYPFYGAGNGLDSSAKKKGGINITNDVRKVFKPLHLANAEQIGFVGREDVFNAWKDSIFEKFGVKVTRWRTFNNFQQMNPKSSNIPFVESKGQLNQIHTRLRRDGGRGRLQAFARNSKNPFAITKDDRLIDSFIREKQRNVGILKSSYFHSAKRIKQDIKVPSWVKQNEGSSNAIAFDGTKIPNKPTVTVGSLIGRKALPASLLQMALNKRALSMRAEMAYRIQKEKKPIWMLTAQGRLSNATKLFL